MARVSRTDIGTLRPVDRRDDGTILADAYLTRVGVFSYHQGAGKPPRLELRLPEHVFDAASLKSFEGRPVTNDHPPGMVDARNARQFAVGSIAGTPTRDGDHVRGRLSVYDADTIAAMDAGKVEISCGYTCDTIEKPGVHPKYGRYDAIQIKILGNHAAVVDHGRAGNSSAARMDGMMVSASPVPNDVDQQARVLHSHSMPDLAPRIDAGSSDPGDEADRNARGADDAKPVKKLQPGQSGNEPARDDDDDEADMDGAGSPYHDGDGNLTPDAKTKIAAASFAIPGKQALPIHDPKAVKSTMQAFGSHEFDSADEKHAAFNRTMTKATQFGMKTAAFTAKHGGKLDRRDRLDKDNKMTDAEIKALQDKAAKRKEKLVSARSKIDQMDLELAAKDGEIASLQEDLKVAKATPAAKTDAADEKTVQARVDAKIELLDRARATGATVTSQMTDTEIKLATIKHVDKKDLPADKAKLEPYVDAMFDGAVERAKKDAAETTAGANALGAARGAIAPVVPGAKLDGQDKVDEDDTDEDAAARRLKLDSTTRWNRGDKETK